MNARDELRAHLICGTEEGMRRADELLDAYRAAVLREAADFLRGMYFDRGYSVQEIGTALRHLADKTKQPARPRCPYCQLPHNLEPGSTAVFACASIRASLAEDDL